jgi:hypothetical protein
MLTKKTVTIALLAWSAASLAQTGLQGFDRNYPNTPAGDNPRGFTPQISPVQSPSPQPSSSDVVEPISASDDPFTTPDPMIDGNSAPDQAADAVGAPANE